MAEAHISLREAPLGNYQQFTDKGANKKFVYLSTICDKILCKNGPSVSQNLNI